MLFHKDRNKWLHSSDNELLKSCSIQHFKASGPGGQHRNKVSSAVRLEHQDSGITVTATNSRNQLENRKHAIKKLRYEIALKVRSEKSIGIDNIEIGPNSKRFHLWLAKIFDILEENKYDIKEAAKRLNISTSKLTKLLAKDPKVWQILNYRRQENGLKTLRK